MASLGQAFEPGIAPTHSPWLGETGSAEPQRRRCGLTFTVGVAFEFIVAESRADADAHVTVPDRVLMSLKGR